MGYTHKSLYLLVRLAGFEPATYGLEDHLSIYKLLFIIV